MLRSYSENEIQRYGSEQRETENHQHHQADVYTRKIVMYDCKT